MGLWGKYRKSIEGDDLFFNPGNILLVFRGKLRLVFYIPGSWNIHREFAELAFEGFGGIFLKLP